MSILFREIACLPQKPIEFRPTQKKSDAFNPHRLFTPHEGGHTLRGEDFKQVSDSKCSVM